MYDDDGAAPVSLTAKVVPAGHSSPLAPWVLLFALFVLGAALMFGVLHWTTSGSVATAAVVADAAGAASSPLPNPPPPSPSPLPIVTRRLLTPPPVRPVSVVPPAAPDAPAASPTDSLEEAARKEDIKRGLEARHQTSAMTLDVPSSSGAPGVSASVAVAPSANSHLTPIAAPSGYDLLPGANIPCRWNSTVDSVIPGGLLKSTITQDVYDSTGTNVVLPAGGTLIGTYGQVDATDASRLGSGWTEFQVRGREIFFDGTGSGRQGENGLSASVETGVGRQVGLSALYTLISGAGTALGNALSHSSSINLGSSAVTYGVPSAPRPKLHIYAGQSCVVTVRTKFTVPQ